MKRLSYGLIILALVACSRELDVTQEWDGPVVEINLDMEEDFQTKAEDTYEQPGDKVFHENDIKWVDFYFYPLGGTGEQVHHTLRKEPEKQAHQSLWEEMVKK